MTVSLRPYSSYKDSGNGFIGNIPSHWKINRQRAMVRLLVSNVDKHTKEGELPVRLCNYVDVYKNDKIHDRLPFMKATATQEEIDRFRLKAGDVVITKDSEAWNDIGVSSLVGYEAPDLICGYHLAILRPDNRVILGGYLHWAHQAGTVATQYHVAANGVTRFGLTQQAIKDVVVPIPPLDEQAAIVRFLDHVDQKIRRFIQAKRRLSELLNEQKQAIVNRAVTRGLNPEVSLKSSDLDWLGDIPEGWQVQKLRHLVRLRGGMTPSKGVSRFWNGDIPWVSPKDMKVERLSDSKDHISEAALDETNISLIPPPAVLIVVRGMILARAFPVAVTTSPVTINQDMKALLPHSSLQPDYLLYLFQGITPHILTLVEESGHGTRCLRTDRWLDLLLPIPEPEEQSEIARFLYRSLAKINQSMDATRTGIVYVKEYHTRLIADVVTGKLDVREAARHLPPLTEPVVPEDEPLDLDEMDDLDDDSAELLSVAADED